MRVRRSAVAVAVAAAAMSVAAVPAAQAQPNDSGRQAFTITDRNPGRGDARVQAEGVIDARGSARDLAGDRTRLTFPRGTLLVEHDANRIRELCNRRTGVGTIVERGTYRITDGTRRYDDARGSGRYVARGEIEDCDSPRAELVELVITAEGRIRL